MTVRKYISRYGQAVAIKNQEIKHQVKNLEGWKVVNGKLNRTFEFSSFVRTFGFMTKVAMEAEKMNHHWQAL